MGKSNRDRENPKQDYQKKKPKHVKMEPYKRTAKYG